MHQVALLGEVEARFSSFGGSINHDERLVHGLRQMYLGHGNRFGNTRMVLLGNVCQVEACFGLF